MSPQRYLGDFEQMIIAAVLRLGDGAYGVTIMDDIAEHAGRSVRSGALSVTLDRLERKGLIRSHVGDPGEGGPGRPRRYVEVTPDGIAAAREARQAMLSTWRGLEARLDR